MRYLPGKTVFDTSGAARKYEFVMVTPGITGLRGVGVPVRNLRTELIPDAWRVLMLAPHPDDFDAVSVTLKCLSRNGNPVDTGVVLTASGVEDAFRPGLTLTAKTGLREREQRNSLRFFGLPERAVTFLRVVDDADDQLADLEDNVDVLGPFIRDKAPDLIILPHGNDANSAHRAMYSLVRRIVPCLSRPVVLWLSRDPKTVAMRYDGYVPFGEVEAAWKGKMLRFHESQQQRNLNTRGYGFDQRILAFNRHSARELGLGDSYAEVFEQEPLMPSRRTGECREGYRRGTSGKLA